MDEISIWIILGDDETQRWAETGARAASFRTTCRRLARRLTRETGRAVLVMSAPEWGPVVGENRRRELFVVPGAPAISPSRSNRACAHSARRLLTSRNADRLSS